MYNFVFNDTLLVLHHHVIVVTFILVSSLFQFTQGEECYQELIKDRTNLEHDIQIKANSLSIDSECMGSRRWFPVAAKLQPNSQLVNKFLLEKLETINNKH